MPTNADFAALSELVYRRGAGEQALTLRELGFGEATTVLGNPEFREVLERAGIQLGTDGDGSFGHFSGLSGSIVTSSSGEIIIVFRGSDGTNAGILGIAEGVLAGVGGPRPRLQDAGAGADFGDWFSNASLGGGTYGRPGEFSDVRDYADNEFATNQWRLAKVLVEAVQSVSNGAEILVAGQSLGGGLAALAAATYNLGGAAFGAAPFQRQLSIEGNVQAISLVAEGNGGELSQSYNEIFTDEFRSIGSDDKIRADNQAFYLFSEDALDLVPTIFGVRLQTRIEALQEAGFINEGVTEVELTEFINAVGSLGETQTDLLSARIDRGGNFYYSSVQGEFTTNHPGFTSRLGDLLNDNADLFRETSSNFDNNFSIGDIFDRGRFGDIIGESLSRHSPALNALLFATSDPGADNPGGNSSGFASLLANNAQLRSAFLFDTGVVSSPTGPKVEVFTDDPSATGFDTDLASEILYRALFRSAIADSAGDRVLYDSFRGLFVNTTEETGALLRGAAQSGFEIAPVSSSGSFSTEARDDKISLNHAITQLALGILRDAVSGTNNLDDVRQRLGGSLEFAGAFSEDNYITLDLGRITSRREEHLDSFDRVFGLRELETFIFDQFSEALSEERAADVFMVEREDLVLGNNNLFNTSVGLETTLLIVDVDANAEGLTVDGQALLARQSANNNDGLTFISGDGDETFTGSQLRDVAILGSGKNTVNETLGSDVIIGGADEDTFIATSGLDELSSTQNSRAIFLGGDGEDTADFSALDDIVALEIDFSLIANPETENGRNHLFAVGDNGPATIRLRFHQFYNFEKIIGSQEDDDRVSFLELNNVSTFQISFENPEATGDVASQENSSINIGLEFSDQLPLEFSFEAIEIIQATRLDDNFVFEGELPTNGTFLIDASEGLDTFDISGLGNGVVFRANLFDRSNGTIERRDGQDSGLVRLRSFEQQLFLTAQDDVTEFEASDTPDEVLGDFFQRIDAGDGFDVFSLSESDARLSFNIINGLIQFDAGDIDFLNAVEIANFELLRANDEDNLLRLSSFSDEGVEDFIAYNAAGGTDTVDLSGFANGVRIAATDRAELLGEIGVVNRISITDGGVNEGGLFDRFVELVTGDQETAAGESFQIFDAERFILTDQSDDVFGNFGDLVGGEINLGGGDDVAAVRVGAGTQVVGGSGSDNIFVLGRGAQVFGDSVDGTGGRDADIFQWAPGVFVQEASMLSSALSGANCA